MVYIRMPLRFTIGKVPQCVTSNSTLKNIEIYGVKMIRQFKQYFKFKLSGRTYRHTL